jgi:hypothetical protein
MNAARRLQGSCGADFSLRIFVLARTNLYFSLVVAGRWQIFIFAAITERFFGAKSPLRMTPCSSQPERSEESLCVGHDKFAVPGKPVRKCKD